MLCLCYYNMGDILTAFSYNEAAGRFSPSSPYYLQNKVFFREVHDLPHKSDITAGF